jgi:hypothetical protein
MLSAVRRLGKLLGRRGTALALLGIGKVSYGLAVQATGPVPRGLVLLQEAGGIRLWSLTWVVCGALTFACAWLRIGRDLLGFIAALTPPLIWGIAYLSSALFYGYTRGLAVFLWFATSHVGVILWISTIPEHSLPYSLWRRRR